MSDATQNPYAVLGLEEDQYRAFTDRDDPALEVFRIAVEAQAQFALLSPLDLEATAPPPPRWAELSGRVRSARQTDPFARPAVGDFVVARSPATEGMWRIEQLLPRRSRFVRQAVRRRHEPQMIAANVDRVLIVTSPNEDFSPRRLERYLTTVHASGAAPVIVLNKRDLVEDPQPWLERARAVALDAPVLAISATWGDGIEALAPILGPAQTVALVGSSGVGKSSLINHLLGAPRQRVVETRVGDDKGRHTTTHRELLPLPRGPSGEDRGFLVDTPGMRAIALWADPEALDYAFADIVALAERCRFRDCRHGAEPGCAVRAEDGISPSRLASFLRLREEAEAHRERSAARGRRSRGRPRR